MSREIKATSFLFSKNTSARYMHLLYTSSIDKMYSHAQCFFKKEFSNAT